MNGRAAFELLVGGESLTVMVWAGPLAVGGERDAAHHGKLLTGFPIIVNSVQ